jgi:hypothetical protein
MVSTGAETTEKIFVLGPLHREKEVEKGGEACCSIAESLMPDVTRKPSLPVMEQTERSPSDAFGVRMRLRGLCAALPGRGLWSPSYIARRGSYGVTRVKAFAE